MLSKELRSAVGCLLVARPRGLSPVAAGRWRPRTVSRAVVGRYLAHARCFDVVVGRPLYMSLARLELLLVKVLRFANHCLLAVAPRDPDQPAARFKPPNKKGMRSAKADAHRKEKGGMLNNRSPACIHGLGVRITNAPQTSRDDAGNKRSSQTKERD